MSVLKTKRWKKNYCRGTDGALTFTPVEPNEIDDVVVAEGYLWEVIIRWGDPLTDRAPEFDFRRQSPKKQREQFGYNSDFLTVLEAEDHGCHLLLWANHESPSPKTMFPD